mgnify:CR=1 FL=1|tara:strand:- start:9 stop:590 length:582 start_codon:yes stop_codon:yes gene_type:complete
MNENKIEFNIDFGGFYESIHKNTIDDRIINLYNCTYDIDDMYSIDDIYEKDNKFMNNIDYKLLQNEYCKQWLSHFNRMFNTHFVFKKIDSPEYYNFDTDQIECVISKGYVNDIINYKDSNLVDFIDESSKSYDGFNSFYVGWDQVIINKAVFMNYYTRWLLNNEPHWIDDVNEKLLNEYEINDIKHYYILDNL